MVARMVRAMKLDVAFYEQVEADPRYTAEAFVVVLIAAVAAGIGTAAAYPGEGALHFVEGVIGTLLSWVAWSGITLWIGTTLTRGPETSSNMGEMLRVLGYAHTPQILILFVFIPVLGPLIALAASIWSLVAGVVAIRQALDFSTGRALITVIIGWVIILIIRGLLAFFL
jgi:hypothetical protein